MSRLKERKGKERRRGKNSWILGRLKLLEVRRLLGKIL